MLVLPILIISEFVYVLVVYMYLGIVFMALITVTCSHIDLDFLSGLLGIGFSDSLNLAIYLHVVSNTLQIFAFSLLARLMTKLVFILKTEGCILDFEGSSYYLDVFWGINEGFVILGFCEAIFYPSISGAICFNLKFVVIVDIMNSYGLDVWELYSMNFNRKTYFTLWIMEGKSFK